MMPYEIKIQERLPQLGTILFFSDGDREVSVIEAAVGVVFVTVSSRRVSDNWVGDEMIVQ